jgi:hypothetical protein
VLVGGRLWEICTNEMADSAMTTALRWCSCRPSRVSQMNRCSPLRAFELVLYALGILVSTNSFFPSLSADLRTGVPLVDPVDCRGVWLCGVQASDISPVPFSAVASQARLLPHADGSLILDASNLNIGSLTAEDLRPYTLLGNVRHLDFSRNQLSHLEPDVFKYARNLRSLRVAWNQLNGTDFLVISHSVSSFFFSLLDIRSACLRMTGQRSPQFARSRVRFMASKQLSIAHVALYYVFDLLFEATIHWATYRQRTSFVELRFLFSTSPIFRSPW